MKYNIINELMNKVQNPNEMKTTTSSSFVGYRDILRREVLGVRKKLGVGLVRAILTSVASTY